MSLVPSTLASLFAARVREWPDREAVRDAGGSFTYAQLERRVRERVARWRAAGVREGDRVAVLSENRIEYLECFLAAAWMGAIAACPSWRLAPPEIAGCIGLVQPALVVVSARHVGKLDGIWEGPTHVLGEEPVAAPTSDEPAAIDAEAPLLILYTSGTTGLPKGAVISHRAQIVRNLVVRAEYGLSPTSAFVAWSPMYHMGGAEYSLGTLISGGTVIVVDGFDAERLADLVATEAIGWLLLMPGMVGRFADLLEDHDVSPRGIEVCGVMADLVPPADLARITRLLGAPYANTFGATETGNPPASAGLVAIGAAPERLSKTPSVYCEIRLVDEAGNDVPEGEPGELWIRGPTLFSGYWSDPDATAKSFADGWFHMGDVFVRNPDGTLDFVDRSKYMIKSGGENIYPAEIERVLLADPRVADAAVVKRPDSQWGEVPVAFVARRDDALTEAELIAACRARLAGFKAPKAIHFVDFDALPRSASGKIVRHALEKRPEITGGTR
ncbi:MAG: AMP-binding protein [Alphaproteobacteria bacterium]|nr:AMP-binding protein [Alphaproteobacteria bacterium]